MEFILIGNFAKSLNYTTDFPPGSILLLFKRAVDPPNGERYEVLIFVLKTGQRKEYFEFFLRNPDFDRYFMYPRYDSSYDTERVLNEFKNLTTDENGRKFYP